MSRLTYRKNLRRTRTMQDKNFIVYEYKTETMKAKDRARAVDEAEAFGWEATETGKAIGACCSVTFRRDRRIEHRAELVRLEKRAKEAREQVTALEQSKTRAAGIFGLIFGICAVLIAGGGMSLIMASEPSLVRMIVGIALGVIGIAMCCLTYPIYGKIVLKKTREVAPAIDSGEEAIANLLEQGNDLLMNKEI